MFRTFFVIVLTILFMSTSFAAPFWGEKASQPVETVPVMLKPGQFIWKVDAVPSGPNTATLKLFNI